VSKRVCINSVCTQVFQHTAHDAFASCDITGQTNHVLARPIAHKDSNNEGYYAILMSFVKISNEFSRLSELSKDGSMMSHSEVETLNI
jgi:hypothetical protein